MHTQAILLKCRPGARFHFGKVGLDVDTALNDTEKHIPSDTLFSAIINLATTVSAETEVKSLIEAFDKGEILISSGFFMLEEGDTRIFFLPKPAHYNQFKSSADLPKKLRKIEYISAGVWNRNAAPKDWESEDYVILQNNFVAYRGELSIGMLSHHRHLELYQEQLLPRVMARVPGAEDSHFYVANICTANNIAKTDADGVPLFPDMYVHYYFLLRCKDQQSAPAKLLQTILQLLPDTGIGGERSVGCGRFESIEIREDFPAIRHTQTSPTYASISLCCPQNSEDLDCFKAYETCFRGGRDTSVDGKLKFVRMIREGGLQAGAQASGSIPNVSSNQTPYLRYGKAFNLPVYY